MSLMSQLHLVPSNPATAYCTEMESEKKKSTPLLTQSIGKTTSLSGTAASMADSYMLPLLPKHTTGLTWTWLSARARL